MTEVFKRHRGVEKRASMCFSILGSERTLDLEVLDLPTKSLQCDTDAAVVLCVPQLASVTPSMPLGPLSREATARDVWVKAFQGFLAAFQRALGTSAAGSKALAHNSAAPSGAAAATTNGGSEPLPTTSSTAATAAVRGGRRDGSSLGLPTRSLQDAASPGWGSPTSSISSQPTASSRRSPTHPHLPPRGDTGGTRRSASALGGAVGNSSGASLARSVSSVDGGAGGGGGSSVAAGLTGTEDDEDAAAEAAATTVEQRFHRTFSWSLWGRPGASPTPAADSGLTSGVGAGAPTSAGTYRRATTVSPPPPPAAAASQPKH